MLIPQLEKCLAVQSQGLCPGMSFKIKLIRAGDENQSVVGGQSVN